MLTLHAAECGLALVDIQERLVAAMPEREVTRALRQWAALVEMAARLKMPIAVSEQYSKGLGRTLPMLREILGKVTPPPRFVDKLEFACTDVPMWEQFVLDAGRRTWLVAGLEAHVCVWQTVRGLRERGMDVHVPADAVLSRRKSDWRTALGLYEQAGCVVTSTEAALFDLVKRAEGDTFRALSKLVK